MRKRISKYKHLHSNRFRYLSSSIPLICVSGLLLVAGIMINSTTSSNQAYANSSDWDSGTTDDADDGITLTLGSASLKKDSTTTSMNYISTPVNIVAKDVESYRIVVQAASGNGSLVGLSNGEEIKGVGTNVAPTAFAKNTWGYKLAEGSVNEAGLANLTYSSLPANGAGANTPAYTQKTANEAANGKAFTLAFAAKFGDDTMPDHYQTDVLVSLAASPKEVVEYSVTYNANGGTGTPNPASQSISSKEDAYTFTVAAQGTLARTGYTFLGWAETNNATTAQYTAGSSTINLTRNAPAKVLYATWKVNLTWDTITTMQQLTGSICKSASNHATKQLTDTRDGKTYWVTKMADGNCWMTQNLDYDDPNSTKVTDSTMSLWSSENSARQYYDPGEKIISGTSLVNASSSTDKHLLVGNYYSWQSATNGAGITDSTEMWPEITENICPAGWKIPTGKYGAEYEQFIKAEGMSSPDTAAADKLKAAPYYFLYGGQMSGSGSSAKLSSVGQHAYYRTSSVYRKDGSNAWTLYLPFINSNYVEAGGPGAGGTFLRCIVKGA